MSTITNTSQFFNDSLQQQMAMPDVVKNRIIAGNKKIHQLNDVIQEHYDNIDTAKSRANVLKFKSIENLEKNLIDFEYAFTRRGGKIVWCDSVLDVHTEMLRIQQKNGAQWCNNSQDDLIREVELLSFFAKNNIIESNKNLAQVNVYTANYLATDTGAAIILNQKALGNNTVNIIISTIDSIIPKLQDVDLFVPLYSTFLNNEFMSKTMTIVCGKDEKALKENILFIVNNGRSKILEQVQQRSSLYCIQCKACEVVCPITQYVGNEAYKSVQSGPIAKVKNQFLYPIEEYKHLSQASTLCGKCSDVCPVNIDIHNQIINNRKYLVDKNLTHKSDNIAVYFWKNNMLKRSKLEKGGASLKNFMLKQFFKKQWGEKREFPLAQAKSFNQIWREKKSLKSA